MNDCSQIKQFEQMVNQELLSYIKTNVFKEYEKNGKAHDISHIMYVLNRAYEISKKYNINYDLLYITVSYHDIGDHIDREHHEIVSAKIMQEDKNLDRFISSKEKNIVKEAIEDHRASNPNIPRNIYGKILASADKNISIDEYFLRAICYSFEHFQNHNRNEHIQRVYDHAQEKFGVNGYAVKKYYVDDDKYKKYLDDLQELIKDKEKFDKKANEICDYIVNKNI